MEDRERELLARDVLSAMLSEGDEELNAKIARFALDKDPDALRGWLMRCASASDLWEGKGAWQPPMGARVRHLLDIPNDADEDWAIEGLGVDRFPDDYVRAMIAPLEEWGTKTANKSLDFIRHWLTLDLQDRATGFIGFRGTLLRADGEPALNLKKPRENHPCFVEGQELIAQAVRMVEDQPPVALSGCAGKALRRGRAFSISMT